MSHHPSDSRPFDVEAFYRDVDRRYRTETGDGVARFLEDALRRARLSGSVDAVCAVASELGAVRRVRGELAEAEALYLEALALLDARPQGSALSRCNLRINLGDVYVAWGRHAEAVAAFDAAEALLPDPGAHPYELSAICNNRSSAYRGQGRLAEARRDLARAVGLLGRVEGSEGQRAVGRVNLAQLLLCEGRLDEAARELAPALLAYETLSGGRDVHKADALATAGRIAYLAGSYDEAAERFGAAADALEDKLGASEAVASLRREQGRAARLAGEAGAHEGA